LREAGTRKDIASVENVSGAVAVPFTASVIVAPEPQDASNGKPLHTGVIVTGPLLLKPFMAVNVSVVVPGAPGAFTEIVVGFAVTVKVGGAVTVSGIEAAEMT